jgi:hypothetical protein
VEGVGHGASEPVRTTTRGRVIEGQAWPKNSPPFQILAAGGFSNDFKRQLVERKGAGVTSR